MKCRAANCYKSAKRNSGFCEKHERKSTFSFQYQEWDEEYWQDRINLLQRVWETEQPAGRKKRIIADLIIHSHDLSE